MLAQPGTAPSLPLCHAHRGSADAGFGHAKFLLSIVTVTFPEMIRGELAMGAEHRAYTLVFGGLQETGP